MVLKQKHISRSAMNTALASYLNSQSSLATQFRQVRNNIRFVTEGAPIRSLLVTSPSKGEGKTTAAMNLACCFAQRGERVLLIDANLHHPMLHQLFGMSNSPGLTDVLAGKSRWEDTIHSVEIERLSFMASGLTLIHGSDLLDTDRMDTMLKETGDKYDLVVVDSPSILDSPETCSLGSFCDGVVVVVAGGKSKRSKVIEAKARLDLADADLLGIVMNYQ